MNSFTTKTVALAVNLGLAAVLLLLLSSMATGIESLGPSPASAEDSVRIAEAPSPARILLAETTVISGTYVGTVAITEPVQLGVVDLAFDVIEHDGVLTGTVNATRTLVYSGGLTLRGTITDSVGGITPTFSLASEIFSGVVSGRQVQRRFALVGEATEGGEILQGLYTEVITGFTPQPLAIEGLFLVTRPPQPPKPGEPAAVALEVNPESVWINGSAAVSATVVSAYGGVLTETRRITFTADLGTVSPPVVDTDEHGVASATFTAGPIPGQATITATTGSLTATAGVEITGYSPATLMLATDATLLPTGGGQAVVTATVLNQIDQPVAGVLVEFAGDLGNMSPVSATTDVDGVATSTFTAGAMPGLASVTATCNDLQDVVTFILQAPQISSLDLQVGTTMLRPGDQTTVEATVRDQFDRPMAGELVIFFGSLGTVVPSSGLSDGNGQVTAIFTAGSLPGQATITVLAGYVSKSVTIQISATNQAPAMPHTPQPANGAISVPLTQTLSWQCDDDDGDPLSFTVAFGTVDPPPVVANSVVTMAFDPGPLSPDTIYYWYIAATDGISVSVGPVWHFSTGTSIPENWIYLPLVVRNASNP